MDTTKPTSRLIALLAGLLLLLLCLAPVYASNFFLFVVVILMINMVWATATWGIFHQAGQALFAVVVIAGVGGYSTALLGKWIPNAWITIPLALVASTIMGIFFYFMATRVRGHIQFAVLNLSFIFIFRYVIVAFTNVTGGIDGIQVRHFYPESFFAPMWRKYFVVLILCSVALLLIHKAMNSRFGKIITLIGRNPQLAATAGINNEKYIFLAYLFFTPMLGLGGILYSHFVGHVAPETWNPDLSLIIVFCTLIGGSSSILGPMIGAILATAIPIYLDLAEEFRFGLVGVLAILIFVFQPEGVTAWLRDRLLPKIEGWQR
jgi:branched-chain amino acid transport system permease protein